VMGSDAHQVLAMSTMFTRDIYTHYGGREKYGERAAVHFARGFIVVVTAIAYAIALYLKEKQGIFEIAIRFAFSGFAAMAPVMIAALFWKRSTKWGALAATLFVAATVVGSAVLQGKPIPLPGPPTKPATAVNGQAAGQQTVSAKPDAADKSTNIAAPVAPAAMTAPSTDTNAKPPTAAAIPSPELKPAGSSGAVAQGKPKNIIWQIGEGADAVTILSHAPNGDVRFLNGYMTVVPMVFGSALCMILFSLLTTPPSRKTIEKYFPNGEAEPAPIRKV